MWMFWNGNITIINILCLHFNLFSGVESANNAGETKEKKPYEFIAMFSF